MNTILMESKIPFGQSIYAWLYLSHISLEKLLKHDLMEQNYLAWECVRKQTNPFLEHGTGFEGYFVGRCMTPEAALDAILAVNQNILDAIARFYRFEGTFQTRLMHTLTREASDSSIIPIWSAYLGAELGRLRVQILHNNQAQIFQQQTYRMVSTLPPITYHIDHDDISQTYTIGKETHPQPGRLSVTVQMLKPSQQDAWLVAENIGQFGHPLIRKYINHEGSLFTFT